MQYTQVFIRAGQTAQAYRILDSFIAKQFVFGGPTVGGLARFLWHFKESDLPESMRKPKLLTPEQDDHAIISDTRENLKEELIEVAEPASLAGVCMIWFLLMETNRALRPLLDASCEGKGKPAAPGPADATAALALVPSAQIPLRTKCSNDEIGIRS